MKEGPLGLKQDLDGSRSNLGVMFLVPSKRLTNGSELNSANSRLGTFENSGFVPITHGNDDGLGYAPITVP